MATRLGKKNDIKKTGPKVTGEQTQHSIGKLNHSIGNLLVAEHRAVQATRIGRVLQRHRTYLIIGSLLAVTVVLVSVYILFFQKEPAEAPSIPASRHQYVGILGSDKVEDVVKDYGSDYHAVFKEVQHSSSSEWDRETSDKVHFALVYADRVGAFAQVYTLLSYIDAAEKSGMNVDDNSFGLDENGRNAILQRADKNALKLKRQDIDE